MEWHYWLAVVSALICLGSLLFHGVRLSQLGPPKDYSKKRGSTSDAIRYAYTGAMNPLKKESAYLHLPTYTAGILYHIGTFLSLFLFILFLARIFPEGIFNYTISAVLIITGFSGLGILIKRMSKQQLRALSNPDDYISNLLVSLVQLITAFYLFYPDLAAWYCIMISLLLLYLPLGKLKHTIYFFAARYHLGFFYGWRGVWPPKQG